MGPIQKKAKKNSACLLSNPQNNTHKLISEAEQCYFFYECNLWNTTDRALYNIVWGNLHMTYDQDS